MKSKLRKCDNTKPVVIVPAGMSGNELKQLRLFDKDQYDGLKSKIRFRSL